MRRRARMVSALWITWKAVTAFESLNASVAFPTMESFYDNHLVKRTGVILSDLWGRDHEPMDTARLLRSCKKKGRTVVDRCEKGILNLLWVPRFATNDYVMRVAREIEVPVAQLAPRLILGNEEDREGCGLFGHALYVALGKMESEGKTMEAGEGLFAPSPVVVRGSFLLYCWVDASNLLDVRAALRRGTPLSYVAVSAHTLSGALDSVATAMDRRSRDLTWEEYSASHRDGQRTRASRNDFREWQHEVRWRWKIVAATIPELEVPRALRVTYDTVWLSVSHSYKPQANDDSKFGVEIDFEEQSQDVVHNKHASTSGRGSSRGSVFAISDFGNASVRPLLPGRAYAFRGRLVYGEATGRWSPFTAEPIFTPMRRSPDRAVEPKVKPGDAPGRVLLTVTPPLDDGGDPISGWIVRARHRNRDAFAADWIGLGSFPSTNKHLQVDHLLPSRCDANWRFRYEFQVAPYNRLGLAEWSELSEAVSPGCVEMRHSLVGRGVQKQRDTHHLPVDDDADDDWRAASDAVKNHLAALHPHHFNDLPIPVAEVTPLTLRVFAPGEYGHHGTQPRVAADLWSSHFSPPHFELAVGQIVLADPIDASATPSDAYRRILFAKRGNVSFSQKALAAQKAGAIALVIFDDGNCDNLDQYCVPGADRSRGEGFAALDSTKNWKNVHIPVGLVLEHRAFHVFQSFPDAFPGIIHDEL